MKYLFDRRKNGRPNVVARWRLIVWPADASCAAIAPFRGHRRAYGGSAPPSRPTSSLRTSATMRPRFVASAVETEEEKDLGVFQRRGQRRAGADADVLIGGPQRLINGLEDRLKGRVVRPSAKVDLAEEQSDAGFHVLERSPACLARVSGLKSHGRPGRRVVALAARRVAPHQPPDEQDEAPREAELDDRRPCTRCTSARICNSSAGSARSPACSEARRRTSGYVPKFASSGSRSGSTGSLPASTSTATKNASAAAISLRHRRRAARPRGGGGGDARGRGRARRRAAARSRRRGYFLRPAEDAGARPQDVH